MADDFDYDDGVLDFDDGWLYVEDEYDLPDELAEGQIPDPGYSGTNNEIDMEGYEFEIYEYFDDLEYGDDSYWDYGSRDSETNVSEDVGQKRKRGVGRENVSPGKRRKTNEDEPLVFRSRSERLRAYQQDAPLNKGKTAYSFLPDWRERFPDEDAPVLVTKMPAEMRKAAEGQNDVTPPKARQLGEEAYAEDDQEGWEDEMEEEEEGGLALDPEMLKTILREKLGAAGLEGMDEAAFMQTLQKMFSGEGDEGDATGDLANALLGKLTSGPGDEALSGWLSGQGVALEDDDASSVATGDVAEGTTNAGNSRHALQASPPDSAVEMKNKGSSSTQMPLHFGSPTTSKKRSAIDEDDQPSKKHKKVQFDVPPSSDSNHAAPGEDSAPPTSEDPLMSQATIARARTTNAAAADANQAVSNEAQHEDGGNKRGGRKRKASSADEKPAGKKTKMRELQDLGPLPEAPSPAPPAKRTRSARSKAGK